MQLLEEFRKYLKELEFSDNTVKNYVSDLSTYVDYLTKRNHYFSLLTLAFVLQTERLEEYKKWLAENLPITTTNRRLAALRKFIEFVTKTNLVSENYVGKIENIVPLTSAQFSNTVTNSNGQLEGLSVAPEILVRRFRNYLVHQGASTNTIKGYISDINYYLGISTTASYSQASVTRRNYSIKKFQNWLEPSRNNRHLPSTSPNVSASHDTVKAQPKAEPNFNKIIIILSSLTIMISLGGMSMWGIGLIDRSGALQRLANFQPKIQNSVPSHNGEPVQQFPLPTLSAEIPVYSASPKTGNNNLLTILSGGSHSIVNELSHRMNNISIHNPWSTKVLDPTRTNSEKAKTKVLGKTTNNYWGIIVDTLFPYPKMVSPVPEK